MTQAPPKRRRPGHVKAAADILAKECRRILKRNGHRLAQQPAVLIRDSLKRLEDLRRTQDWPQLEDECEGLDELLHRHASFARKSPLRETLENVSIAVIVALGLRSCLYEPFKIPSGSMMPTLRSGDHIFVNKFTYGIQLPFTNTVIGQFVGEPKRGDVIVFRYPVDEAENFIKRVIGLPGDTVRVEGNKVSIRRAGEQDFETLAREKLSDPCLDEAGVVPVPHCTLYRETLDGRSYVVRYMSGDPRLGAQRRFGEWNVPDAHYLVMGDNRNQSHDSLAWTRQVEAISADGLLSVKDLRDLTTEKLFTLNRPDQTAAHDDSTFDHIVYMADHASDGHGLQLEVWRAPVLGRVAMYETLVEQLGANTAEVARGPLTGLVADTTGEGARSQDTVREVAFSRDEVAYTAVLDLTTADSVMALRCGLAVCSTPAKLAERIVAVVDQFDNDRSVDARELLVGDPKIRYSQHWTQRGPTAERFIERTFQAAKPVAGGGSQIRLRAWRSPDEPTEMLRDAVLMASASNRAAARQVVDDSGEDAWLATTSDGFTFVRVDATARVVFALECGRQRCPSDSEVLALARTIQTRVPAVSRERSRLQELLTTGDLPGWRELPATLAENYEYDRMRLEGTVREPAYSLSLKVWRRPPEGLEAKFAELRRELHRGKPDESVAPGGFSGPLEVGQGSEYIFVAPTSESVVQLRCHIGLCPSDDVAQALAIRAYEKAQDPSNFIDPNAERPRPFVPRGHVKGRADRIWLPLSRFWLAIR